MTATAKTWPIWMKVLWQLMALFVLAIQLPTKTYVDHDGTEKKAGWIYHLNTPPSDKLRDFYQEWGSARNWYEGIPIYENQRVTIPIHLGIEVPKDAFFSIE